jgi:hypothetical protein
MPSSISPPRGIVVPGEPFSSLKQHESFNLLGKAGFSVIPRLTISGLAGGFWANQEHVLSTGAGVMSSTSATVSGWSAGVQGDWDLGMLDFIWGATGVSFTARYLHNKANGWTSQQAVMPGFAFQHDTSENKAQFGFNLHFMPAPVVVPSGPLSK